MLGNAHRMKRLALIALSVSASLLISATASADGHRMTFEFASAVAVDYWAQQDRHIPCTPTPYLMSETESDHATDAYGSQVDMLSDAPSGCTIDISVTAEAYRTDRDLDWMYCQDIAHEFGHLAGLDDDTGGLMDLPVNVVPFGCAHQRQWMVLQGWRKPPRWVRDSPSQVRKLWLQGHGYAAQTARQDWLKAERHKHHRQPLKQRV
jgi:hypothetical protein